MLSSSLRAQTLTLLGASLALMLLISLLSLLSLSGGLRTYQALLDGPLASSMLINETNVAFKSQVQEWKNVLLRGGSTEERDRYWKQFQEQEQQVQALLSRAVAVTNDSTMRQRITALQDEHRRLGEGYRQGLQSFIAAGSDPAAGDRGVRGIDRATSDQLQALVVDLAGQAEQQAELVSREAKRAFWIGLGILIGAAIFVGLISSWLVNRRLVNPITHLIRQIEQLSQGRIGQPFVSQRRDELGTLASAANQLRGFLADTFSRLQHSTEELDRASGELNTIATRMAAGSRDQFNRTDQVATAMQEMSATAGEVARHAAEAAQAANQADENAQQGELVMQSTISAMQRMLVEIERTTDVIQRLEGDSHRIGKVLEVIQSIAEQTNLLALNAAIEAARAGEAGRGFAVVADEVRTLAKRTSDSTAEIQQIIHSVQQGSIEAVKAIESGQVSSTEGMQQVNLAGERLRQITLAVESIRDMNQQIATAAEEQTSVAEDITRNITEITQIAAANQADVDRTSQASTTLHGLSGELSQLTTRLSA
ncbi:MAG: methyl-accepting chemotaxis protein [Gammaproteobacteria bacterium HGW-Gammaproteobacteria-11]|nr:MAG: methyl-accepting chemotaxis protein [Gammaproteobacteria bacterium HGW-Gammaproteobacteria-11]